MQSAERPPLCAGGTAPPPIDIVVAYQRNNLGIGWNGTLPWNRCSKDMRKFKTITTTVVSPNKTNAVLMGRKTFESIGKPLENRINVVVSRSEEFRSTVTSTATAGVVAVFGTIEEALEWLDCQTKIDRIMVIGGATLYNAFLRDKPALMSRVHRVHTTVFYTEFPSDTFLDIMAVRARFDVAMTAIDRDIQIRLDGDSDSVKTCTVEFTSYTRKNLEEEAYLNLLRKVVDNGLVRSVERTGVGTFATFGERLEFDLSNGSFPLMTSRRTPFKTIARELLWFLSGSTDATILKQQGVGIWDGNTSREFLNGRGLDRLPVGDLGSGYGFQWRHFGAEYVDCKTDYTGKGVDQIQAAIDLIRTDPESRRIIVTAWNPAQESSTALMPCHCFFQFFVDTSVTPNRLDCMLYQRSCDLVLGVPFNIASYSLLTCMIAHVTGKTPGRFIHVMGDAHVYKNHTDGVRELLTRTPRTFPKLSIVGAPASIFDFGLQHFMIEDYSPLESIKFDMAV